MVPSARDRRRDLVPGAVGELGELAGRPSCIASRHRSKSPPSRVDANTIALPSGVHTGCASIAGAVGQPARRHRGAGCRDPQAGLVDRSIAARREHDPPAVRRHRWIGVAHHAAPPAATSSNWRSPCSSIDTRRTPSGPRSDATIAIRSRAGGAGTGAPAAGDRGTPRARSSSRSRSSAAAPRRVYCLGGSGAVAPGLGASAGAAESGFGASGLGAVVAGRFFVRLDMFMSLAMFVLSGATPK